VFVLAGNGTNCEVETAHAWKLAGADAADGEPATLLDEVVAFVRRGGVVLGICNGFQLLVKVGLLPGGGDDSRRTATLGPNVRGRFEDRWVRLLPDAASPCIFTKGMTEFELPVRHGEGRLLFVDDVARRGVVERRQIPLRFGLGGLPTDRYPFNPNGSEESAAALTDPTGRILGLMPHPEAFVVRTQHPRWTRESRDVVPEEGSGLRLFRNAVRFVQGG